MLITPKWEDNAKLMAKSVNIRSEELEPRFQSTTLGNMPLYPGECLFSPSSLLSDNILFRFCYCIIQEFCFPIPSFYVFMLQVSCKEYIAGHFTLLSCLNVILIGEFNSFTFIGIVDINLFSICCGFFIV